MSHSRRRLDMVTRQLRARGIQDARVLAAMAAVPREQFVTREQNLEAYADQPLPIGAGQTISQPYVVARMAELAEIRPTDRVLDIGTGSGYQAAVLAKLSHSVRGVEIRRELAELARRNLDELGLEDVAVRVGDGGYGWAEHGPYDAILVAAAAREVPVPLAAQLADGGRMVIPLGEPRGQELVRLIRHGDGFTRASFGPVRFVAFMGDYGERLAPSGN
ncbi:MAG TPA: protein-L-isoaspartate(D-aspartate) O-methyltransferase [Kofleriaceae bacterium]|nr:protein-L-isoaspartate(D-aspartate) O-methyltransferase [Kofleriaceae bacterium]